MRKQCTGTYVVQNCHAMPRITTVDIYCRSGNIRKFLIFANFARRQIREFNNTAKNIFLIALVKKNKKSRKFKHAKITRSTVCTIACIQLLDM